MPAQSDSAGGVDDADEPANYAIQAGDTLTCRGWSARNGKDTSQVQGDIGVQVKTIADNAGEILKAAGMSHGDLVQGRVALQRHGEVRGDERGLPRLLGERSSGARELPGAAARTFRRRNTFMAIIGIVAARGDRSGAAPTARQGQPGANLSPAIKVGNRLFISGGTGSDAGE